ncbi:MAG: hypothetical protein H7177_17110 [Rhizobacter sp.]|nr:hypothetical protein [Bacteriovorax sp.]
MSLSKKLQQEVHEEHGSDELWAISYGDMITLLLSFFVIYFSIDPKKTDQEKVDNHLITHFKMLDLTETKKSTSVMQFEKNHIGDAPKFEPLKNAKITKIDDRLLVTFDSMEFFKTADIDPNNQGIATLQAFAAKFMPYAGMYKVSIKAFTDTRAVKNGHRFKDNLELSALRALAALRIMQKAGIPLSRMEIAGYGEMNKLSTLVDSKQLAVLTEKEIKNISRTIVLIIKHENEQSVL